MSKSIHTVAEDILGVLNGDAGEVRIPINDITVKGDREPREHGKMWASDVGEKCLRKLWYKFNAGDKSVAPGPELMLKFSYGHMIEDLVLNAARLAGHSVEYEQHRVEVEAPAGWSVSGKLDAVINNTLVDVKTTSSYAFKKYTQEGLTVDTDSFGYRYQLAFYKEHTEEEFDGVGLLCVDKQHANVAYVPVDVPRAEELNHKIEENINAIEADDEGCVPRAFGPTAFGKSGNAKIGIECSFCAFKHVCWREANGGAGIRTFDYKFGPVELVDVVNEPRVEEITTDA